MQQDLTILPGKSLDGVAYFGPELDDLWLISGSVWDYVV
jgi:hypothetical protein